MKTKASSILFAAERAATNELPPESFELILARDEAGEQWRKAGYPRGPFKALDDASAALNADPLASAVMKLRVLGNEAARREDGIALEDGRDDVMTRVLEDYERLKTQLRTCEKHAGEMAKAADAEHEKYIIEKGLVRIYDAEREAALKVLAELNVRVNSGYDFNADPDSITLLVGAALARERFPAGWAAGAGVWRCASATEKEANS